MKRLPFGVHFAEPRREDHRHPDPPRRERLDRRQYLGAGEAHEGQINVGRQVGGVCDGGKAEDRLAARVDGVHAASEAVIQDILQEAVAELGGAAGDAQHRDAPRPEERGEPPHRGALR